MRLFEVVLAGQCCPEYVADACDGAYVRLYFNIVFCEEGEILL